MQIAATYIDFLRRNFCSNKTYSPIPSPEVPDFVATSYTFFGRDQSTAIVLFKKLRPFIFFIAFKKKKK
jgi:hypothetical protein